MLTRACVCVCVCARAEQVSLYFVITVLTTVGFGDITAQTPAEFAFVTLLMIAGSSVFAYTTATVASIITNGDTIELAFRSRMDALRHFAKVLKLSKHTTRDVVSVMSTIWRESVNETVSWSLVDSMPPALRVAVLSEVFGHTLGVSHLFGALRASPGAARFM